MVALDCGSLRTVPFRKQFLLWSGARRPALGLAYDPDFDRDLRLADEAASTLNSDNPDLRSSRDHGGKLSQYHGWGDGAIAPRTRSPSTETPDVSGTLPHPRSTKPTEIQAFYRFFMVPGIQHCTGGPGAVSFGNDDSRPSIPNPAMPAPIYSGTRSIGH